MPTLADLPRMPVEHFKLFFYAAVARLRERLPGAAEQFPFLAAYFDELDGSTTGGSEELAAAIRAWERDAQTRLPLADLREAAALDDETLTLLFTVGLAEEDPRFGLVFQAVYGAPGVRRPTVALLNAWSRTDDARPAVRRLRRLGLVEVVNPDAPRMEWALQAAPVAWDVLRGSAGDELAPWARYRRPDELVALDELIAPEDLLRAARRAASVLAAEGSRALIVRGPQASGRRTLVGAVARALGVGLLEVDASAIADGGWRLVGPLATLLPALPVVALDPGPGETAELPELAGSAGTLAVVLGRQGGVAGASVEVGLTLTLGMPDVELRRRHWEAGFAPERPHVVDVAAERYRMTGGNIRRATALARSAAALAGGEETTALDVREASRTLHGQLLDTLAERVPVGGDWSDLAVGAETMRELVLLEQRCRNRERLGDFVGAALRDRLTPGVRALFTGASGTGKTLAARLLASVLGVDLYRLDLSTVVNKYLGETEKNLSRVFARAEEADVALLLDEGDALLTQRTSVQTANDRYANLETNYLLQRLESFEGILVVTTNAGDRIDRAFKRRMDVVIEFRAPEPFERWAIWELHLPSTHAIERDVLEEVSVQCALTGGQIRNAVLHASLLALEDGGTLASQHLLAAVRREYRKSGEVFPLERQLEAVSAHG